MVAREVLLTDNIQVKMFRKERALNGAPSQRYGASFAIWDGTTVLSARRPPNALTPARPAGTRFA